jgi:uncharacterized protein (TIGR02596 family)
MMIPAHHCRLGREPLTARGGFTLVEMLVVLAIISILAVLTMPAMKGMLGSMDMKGGANMTAAQLELARQTASTRNVQTDVRIYQDPNTVDPNSTPNNAYRIIAVVIPASASGAAADEFVSPGLALPGDIVYDQSTTYSTLLATAGGTTTGDGAGNARYVSAEASTAPLQLRNRPYVKFSYLPNGTVYLENTTTTSGGWCLSLRNIHAPALTSAPAQNFITFVLDPTSSRARVYQP